jgi:glycosyltransferase involved in cell wall biosynthesis
VDALSLLARRHPDAHLAIAGRGELDGALRARAVARGVADRLHLLGLRPDVPNLLASADIFALSSLAEGLPLSLLEAMFAARGVVASAVGGVPAALAHGRAGVIVEPGNAAALAEAIAGLLDEPARARRLGERAARRAAAKYHVAHMVARYSALYAGLRSLAPLAKRAPGAATV